MVTQKQIFKMVTNCCEYTGGCERCNPWFPPYHILDKHLGEMAKNALPIEEIHKITAKIPQRMWDEARGKVNR